VAVCQAAPEDVEALARFMLENAADEMTEAPVDPAIYTAHLARTVRDGAALVALVDGSLAGFLGLMCSPYCYAADGFLHDTGLYVLPRHRGGAVLRALLAEARGIADEAGMNLKIIDTNPTRPRHAKGQGALTGTIIGYRPAGRVLTFMPRP
jgi:GNAT superfamily N-acetyltransferase